MMITMCVCVCVCEREMNENKNTMYHTQKKLHNIIYIIHTKIKKRERNTIYSQKNTREHFKKLKYYLDRYYVYTRYNFRYIYHIIYIIYILIYA